jgi:deoxyribodipyrimidine photo-lyase
MFSVPTERIRELNDRPIRPEGDFVLYWMVANRRPHWNYSLDRAVEHCLELNKPLLVLEALRCGYRWASDRIHRFVIQGMADNRNSFRDTPARYYAYLEASGGAGAGLLSALAESAAVIVTDDFPCFFLPRMVSAAAEQTPVQMEAVDSNGMFPLQGTDRVFARAFDFRRHLQKTLPPFLSQFPQPEPLQAIANFSPATIPRSILDRWPEASDDQLAAKPATLARLPLDHQVGPAAFDGGTQAARAAMDRFFEHRFERYAEHRNDPDDEAASGFSPYLHFGHLSVHEIFDRLVDRENWSMSDLSNKTGGARSGWWGMSDSAESFLDELITWRELGYNMCAHQADYDQYESLPDWAQKTLAEHAPDERPFRYESEEFEAAATHDPLWNAAQRQLVREGRMHNYMRMLWGKKILEWSTSPQHALQTMIHLNNKYAVDGRNPNSYSGIFWVLGRYDRAWGPERPIFGKIRYMSSDNTARKLNVKRYLTRYAANSEPLS